MLSNNTDFSVRISVNTQSRTNGVSFCCCFVVVVLFVFVFFFFFFFFFFFVFVFCCCFFLYVCVCVAGGGCDQTKKKGDSRVHIMKSQLLTKLMK